jgi:hypothetical protein
MLHRPFNFHNVECKMRPMKKAAGIGGSPRFFNATNLDGNAIITTALAACTKHSTNQYRFANTLIAIKMVTCSACQVTISV